MAISEAWTVLIKEGPQQFFLQISNTVTACCFDGQHPPTHTTPQSTFSTILPDQVKRHSCSVTIVIYVHNALNNVQHCIDSVLQHTTSPFSLIIIDDGSDVESAAFIVKISKEMNAKLIRNESAKGYTLAANQGMDTALEDFVILLNSNTIVSDDWLDRMIMCAESSQTIGMVGPLSNTAYWQSVPNIAQHRDRANNPLPEGMSISQMAKLVAINSPCFYPRLSFLDGFCLLIKKAVIDGIGHFDESTLGQEFYGEHDYCIRARMKGWELAVANDVYVYHTQSKDDSSEYHQRQVEKSYKSLLTKYNASTIDNDVLQCRLNKVMLGIRARARRLHETFQLIEEGRKIWQGIKVAILLPISCPGGGGNIVISEALAMMQMGVEVKIINLKLNKPTFLAGYPDLNIPIDWVDNGHQITEFCEGFDVIIATAWKSVQWLKPFITQNNHPKLGYYIQDYEPFFYDLKSKKYQEAKKSYNLIPNIIKFTKTTWNQKTLYDNLGLDSVRVGVSVNLDLFRPYPTQAGRWPKGPLRITAMIRNSSPRVPYLTMNILKKIKDNYQDKVEIVIFGSEEKEPFFSELTTDFAFTNHGIIAPEKLAQVINECDIFADFSQYQAMGLTALEAMACGVATILPLEGGANDFAQDKVNCLQINTHSESACIQAVTKLLDDHRLRNKLQRNAIQTTGQYHPERVAHNILECIFTRESTNEYCG